MKNKLLVLLSVFALTLFGLAGAQGMMGGGNNNMGGNNSGGMRGSGNNGTMMGNQGMDNSQMDMPGIPMQTRYGTFYNMPAESLWNKLQSEQRDYRLINVHVPYYAEIPGTDSFMPFDRMENYRNQLPQDKDAEIIVYCMSGRMAEYAAESLLKMGYTNVKNLDGGMMAWQQQGLPLTQTMR